MPTEAPETPPRIYRSGRGRSVAWTKRPPIRTKVRRLREDDLATALSRLKVVELRLLAVTHPDQDHLEGLPLLSKFIETLVRTTFESYASMSSGIARSIRVGAVSAFHPGKEVSWEDLNRRRHNLIDKDMDKGLTPGEEAELRILQEKAEEYLDLVDPEPFGIFERLKECAAKDGLTVNLDSHM
jgi:hypothetical protein